MSARIAVVGTGGTGSTIGGLLTKAGHEITMIDQWPEHVESMRATGLQMATREEDFRVPVFAMHLHEVCNLREPFDIVFLACKSYDSLWQTRLILPYLKPDGVLVSAQNSINEEWLAPIVGADRTMGCVVTMSSEVFEPGHVRRNTAMNHTTFTLGELDGKETPRLLELQRIMSDAGKTETTTNLSGLRWAKLVFNTIVAPVCAIAGIGPLKLPDAPERVYACLRLGKESLEVGRKLGYRMEPVFGLSMDEALKSPELLVENLIQASSIESSPESRSFFHQDILKGRKTEVDYINGLVSRKGREAGVPTPANDTATDFVKRLESGDLTPEPDNVLELEAELRRQTD